MRVAPEYDYVNGCKILVVYLILILKDNNFKLSFGRTSKGASVLMTLRSVKDKMKS